VRDPAWHSLRQELRHWRADGLRLPLWWRDDDAIAPTAQLDRLADLAREMHMQVHLAIIPEFATPALDGVLKEGPFIPVVHGWGHHNHAPRGQKSAEFGHPRTAARAELTNGLARLQTLYGAKVAPIFVPPWNRIDARFGPYLVEAGYRSLSTYGPRDHETQDGLTLQNTHIDPIDWHGTRSAVAVDILLGRLTKTLQDRRTGQTDRAEPLGLLTHHLVHDAAIWQVARQLLSELLDAGAEVDQSGA